MPSSVSSNALFYLTLVLVLHQLLQLASKHSLCLRRLGVFHTVTDPVQAQVLIWIILVMVES